jgi:hypothetical protein
VTVAIDGVELADLVPGGTTGANEAVSFTGPATVIV